MKDDLFSRDATVKDFLFDNQVATVFDDMLVRSVPFYEEIQRMVVELSSKTIGNQPGAVYDIGCSTGTTLIQLMQAVDPTSPVRFCGIEPSDAMRERFTSKLGETGITQSVELRAEPIEDIPELPDARVIIMLFTLQFVRPIQRPAVVRMLHDSLSPGGVLLLGEKIVADDGALNRTYIDLYYDFKRRSGYSTTEIARKREALENVLVPYRPTENRKLLAEAGFGPVDEVFRWYNFALYIACRE
ncbi:MAG: carboxy-S-adenosyl-L-methionine synthase CmoA [Dactylosporangium sp.]|nr:carboxy-S-adenosyl-L-methionine synthase CmoA [Dactylosporangium sp.]NNJ63914.1 carboxy-S-adenosyl-L-methionine synthase CmoA [Dactylosporangium sp.]